ncbi:MAG: hypothetical protein JWN15_1998 [Firmicutes bacterium]|nr:hypothetical protein [Bacillota bacterium]
MPQFTRHAYERFQTRREELVSHPSPLPDCQRSALESYMLGQLITREEAQARIQGAIRPHFNRHDYIYRADGTGPGVWIARLSRRDEVVLTYLAPRELAWKLRCSGPSKWKRPRLVVRLSMPGSDAARRRLHLSETSPNYNRKI